MTIAKADTDHFSFDIISKFETISRRCKHFLLSTFTSRPQTLQNESRDWNFEQKKIWDHVPEGFWYAGSHESNDFITSSSQTSTVSRLLGGLSQFWFFSPEKVDLVLSITLKFDPKFIFQIDIRSLNFEKITFSFKEDKEYHCSISKSFDFLKKNYTKFLSPKIT